MIRTARSGIETLSIVRGSVQAAAVVAAVQFHIIGFEHFAKRHVVGHEDDYLMIRPSHWVGINFSSALRHVLIETEWSFTMAVHMIPPENSSAKVKPTTVISSIVPTMPFPEAGHTIVHS